MIYTTGPDRNTRSQTPRQTPTRPNGESRLNHTKKEPHECGSSDCFRMVPVYWVGQDCTTGSGREMTVMLRPLRLASYRA